MTWQTLHLQNNRNALGAVVAFDAVRLSASDAPLSPFPPQNMGIYNKPLAMVSGLAAMKSNLIGRPKELGFRSRKHQNVTSAMFKW